MTSCTHTTRSSTATKILILSLLIAITALLAGCGKTEGPATTPAAGGAAPADDELPPSPPGLPLPTGAVQAECISAPDCAPVPDGCCPCTASGKQKAMSAASAKTYLLEQRTRCAGTVCAQVISNDPSCSKKAACKSGKCVLE